MIITKHTGLTTCKNNKKIKIKKCIGSLPRLVSSVGSHSDLTVSEHRPMFSPGPRLFPQHHNFCSDYSFHFIRSAYARGVTPKGLSGEKLMTKVEGNLAEPALGDLNVKPASLFWVCVCFSKAFMLCLVKNTAWLCCVLCYVQNTLF